MSFNPAAGKSVIRIRQHLPENPTVLELGSQTLSFRLKGKEEVDTTPKYYEMLGFSRYDAVDTDGKGTINEDLNVPHVFGPYDLVTNSGTGEHIFDQASVFRTVHDSTKAGGVMLHILPYINWRNHGFYNFSPLLFYDLATENGYEVIEIYQADRNGDNDSPVDDREIKNPEPTDINFFVVAALKKTHDAPFKYPTQGKYRAPVRVGFDLTQMEVFDDPFPHAIGKIDDALYQELERTFPETGFKGLEGQNKLHQINAAEAFDRDDIHPVWKEFIALHTSKIFLQEVLKLFMPHIGHVKHIPFEVGLRGGETPFQMDCQFAINTPVQKKSSVRGPHVDDPRELIAGLLYMPVPGDKAGGDLQLYRWKGKREFVGRKGMKKKAEARNVELVKTIPYEPNTFVLFVNSADSVHGVSPRSKTDVVRRYVNFLAEVQEPLFELS